MKPITIKGYWKLKKDVEIYNAEAIKIQNKIAETPISELTSKVVYDLAGIIVRRDTAEKVTKEFEKGYK